MSEVHKYGECGKAVKMLAGYEQKGVTGQGKEVASQIVPPQGGTGAVRPATSTPPPKK